MEDNVDATMTNTGGDRRVSFSAKQKGVGPWVVAFCLHLNPMLTFR